MACLELPEPPAPPDIFPIVLEVPLPALTVSAELCCKVEIVLDPAKFIPVPLLAVIPEPNAITVIRIAVKTQMEIIKSYLRAIPRECTLE